jgi:dipeptidyl-peptidase-4
MLAWNEDTLLRGEALHLHRGNLLLHVSYPAIATLLCSLPLLAGHLSPAQEATGPKAPPTTNPNLLSINDVCSAAVPRAEQGNAFQWSPDGSAIAYFKPAEKGFDLRMEMDIVNADGNQRSALLSPEQLDKMFPARVDEESGMLIPDPKSTIGFQWGPDSGGLLVFSTSHIFWLDRKSLETRPLITGKEPISDVQLSPDGRWAAFVRGHNLWVISVAGGAERAITQGGDETLRKGELDWLYPTELGTRHGFAWSPDSTHLAYLEFNLKSVASYTPPFQSGKDDQAPTIDYPTPGTPIPVVQVHIAGLKEKSSTALVDTGTEKNIYLPRIQWLPDGRSIAVERLNRAQNHLDLLIADAHTGASKVLLTETDPYWINLSDTLYFFKTAPQFLWSNERSGYRHLLLFGLDGKPVRQLTDGKWEVISLDAVNERERKVYFTSTEKSSLERQLYVTSLDGGEAKRISTMSGTHEASFAPDTSAYVDTFSTVIKLWTRTVYRVGGPVGQLSDGPADAFTKAFVLDETSPAASKAPPLKEPFLLTMKTHDGVELNAMLLRPAAFNQEKKYPAIVYMYGGPGGQAVHDAWDGDISMWEQFLAQSGYVVFAVDNRGTAGRGHVFEENIHLRFSGQEISDQRDGVQFLKSLPYIDPARIGVWGRGFGGALTVTAMLHPPLFFKAGFAVAPVVNWFHYDAAFAEKYLGDPVTNQDGYLASSPLEYARSLKGPLLIGLGTSDLKVHLNQPMELQRKLVEARKYAEIALYPGQAHINKPDACSVLYQRATDFFAKSL